jgi:Ca-activated chloride channel homolog
MAEQDKVAAGEVANHQSGETIMTRLRFGAIAVGVLALLAVTGAAQGAGFLVPTDEKIPPLAIKYLRVDTTIDNQVATTHVTQEFQNSTSQQLECTYYFPLPKTAAIRNFSMYINGKLQEGQLVEKEQARQVYEQIVRRARDPGLLEYVDGNVLRMRVFPVPANGTQKIEIEYSEMVPMDEGLAEYVFPLKLGQKASRTLDDFTVAVKIKSKSAIKTVYSPTYEIGVSRPSDHEAVAGMEAKGALLDRDFQLFYTVGDKDFGLSLMTYRPDPEQAGMFVMLLAPKSEINAADRVARDLVLVLDTSGSMRGEKLDQAKKALKFCLDKLEKKDRFSIVQFSTSAETYAEGWTDASEDNLKKAQEWVGKFEAAGGTSIYGALSKVNALKYDEARPATVIFITDGQPTVDVTDPEKILASVKENNKKNLRMFTFGVGDDVNTKLLDKMAGETGGLPEYVRDGEAVDGKITRLASKMTHPVLTNLSVEVTNVKVAEMYPKDLPDLFRGSQVVLVGSYTGDGPAAVRLKGSVGSKKEEFVYEETFPKKSLDKTFIGSLYAQRKIGFLLDQIRLNGENKELKDEVIRLSLAYGIETPFTSYLVLENADQYKQYGIKRNEAIRDGKAGAGSVAMGPSAGKGKGGAGGGGRGDYAPSPMPTTATPPAAAPAEAEDRARRAGDSVARMYDTSLAYSRPKAETNATGTTPDVGAANWKDVKEKDFQDETAGKKAVDVAKNILALRQAEGDKRSQSAKVVQNRGGRQFVNFRGVWVDEKFGGTEEVTKIKWGSDAYFDLLRAKPDLKDFLALGEQVVIVTAKGKAVAIDSSEGTEKLTADEIKALLTDAPEKKVEEKK